MGERARRINVSTELRKQVKHEQGCICPLCQRRLDEHDLYVHHIVPVSHHKKNEGKHANRRENLVALCSPCHEYADRLAIEDNVYLHEVIMLPSVEYAVSQASSQEYQASEQTFASSHVYLGEAAR